MVKRYVVGVSQVSRGTIVSCRHCRGDCFSRKTVAQQSWVTCGTLARPSPDYTSPGLLPDICSWDFSVETSKFCPNIWHLSLYFIQLFADLIKVCIQDASQVCIQDASQVCIQDVSKFVSRMPPKKTIKCLLVPRTRYLSHDRLTPATRHRYNK